MRTVISKPGEIIDFETVFAENPKIGEEPERCGRVERVDYTTDVYEDGISHPKYAIVYLPYCYDEADTARKYNVLYYQHGNTCEPEIFTGENQKKLDILFDSGEIEPCIIVSTTYYFDIEGDREERKRTGMAPAGDGPYEGIKPNFWREVIEDIIPTVESKYNTYLTGTSPEEIKAARDHRAFSGYSRGSVATWNMFNKAFEYFRWYAPMSCHTTAGRKFFGKVEEEDVIAFLREPIEKYPELPFYIYASNGGERDIKAMTEQMKYITKAEGFSYGTDPKENNIYFSVSDYYHSDILVPLYYYNSLKVLFKA